MLSDLRSDVDRSVCVVDYASCNVVSISRHVVGLGYNPVISDRAADVKKARKIIMPGIGHFDVAMKQLRQRDLISVLNEAVLERGVPILGICLGMQLMTNGSEESCESGFGWINGSAHRIKVSDDVRYKIPHIGWSQIEVKDNSKLFPSGTSSKEFYFAHSYAIRDIEPIHITAQTTYETPIIAAIETQNIFGVQFHPEKSREQGGIVLRNFLSL